jgi:hypothetical protein
MAERSLCFSGCSLPRKFSTVVREIGHEMLRRGERSTLTTKSVRENEAEAESFAVCPAIGLENGSSAAEYIQIWNGGANLLRESLKPSSNRSRHAPSMRWPSRRSASRTPPFSLVSLAFIFFRPSLGAHRQALP